MDIAEKTLQLKQDFDAVYEAGKKAEHDRFWDIFQNVERRRWVSAFEGKGWNDETFYPNHDIVPVGDAASLFRYCGITDLEARLIECGVILDTSGATNLNGAFGESNVTALPALNISKCTTSITTGGIFSGCYSLKTIRKIITSEATVWNNLTFQLCRLLENLIIEGVIGAGVFNVQWSTNLTHESLMSIINALQDKTGDTSGTAWKLTLGPDNIAKLTADELLMIENKGWLYQ